MTIPRHKKFKPAEKFLIDQFTNINTVRGVQWTKRIFSGVPALKSRDCRRFFFGQLVSHIGSWMQVVALSWVSYQITQSAWWVGVIAAATAIPALVFSLIGGTIVDRFPKRTVLLVTHTVAAIVAFTLGTLAFTNQLTVPTLILFSFIGGIINSIYTPAHYTFISELVDKDTIPSAISVNAAVSSLARVLGPALAGIYIKLAGGGGAFIINGVSYLAVIFAIMLIKKGKTVKYKPIKTLEAIKEGLIYCYQNPMLRYTNLYVAASAIFAWSYVTLIPVIAEKIFKSGAVGVGNLHTAVGLGAIVATFFSAYYSHRLKKITLFTLGNTLFSVNLFLLTLTTNFSLGLLFTFLAGFGITIITTLLGIVSQVVAAPVFRGRVTSIYYMFFGGIAFIGNLEVGYLSDLLGPQAALRLNTSIMLVIGLIVLAIQGSLRNKQKIYNQKHANQYV